jgi:hypothetical protein
MGNNVNYWAEGFRTEIIPINLVAGQLKYNIENVTNSLEKSNRIVGIGHRVPNTNAYTQDRTGTNRLMIDATIFHAAILRFKNISGNEQFNMPLSYAGIRDGGDNFFFRIPEGVDIDWRFGKSQVEIVCTTGILATAAGANQVIELVVFYIEDGANC